MLQSPAPRCTRPCRLRRRCCTCASAAPQRYVSGGPWVGSSLKARLRSRWRSLSTTPAPQPHRPRDADACRAGEILQMCRASARDNAQGTRCTAKVPPRQAVQAVLLRRCSRCRLHPMLCESRPELAPAAAAAAFARSRLGVGGAAASVAPRELAAQGSQADNRAARRAAASHANEPAQLQQRSPSAEQRSEPARRRGVEAAAYCRAVPTDSGLPSSQRQVRRRRQQQRRAEASAGGAALPRARAASAMQQPAAAARASGAGLCRRMPLGQRCPLERAGPLSGVGVVAASSLAALSKLRPQPCELAAEWPRGASVSHGA